MSQEQQGRKIPPEKDGNQEEDDGSGTKERKQKHKDFLDKSRRVIEEAEKARQRGRKGGQ